MILGPSDPDVASQVALPGGLLPLEERLLPSTLPHSPPPPSCVTAAVLSLLWASELPATGWAGVGGGAKGTAFTPPHSHPQYGIVLDAGSSHTSMFIYKWRADKENDTGIVSQHSACDVSGEGPPSTRCSLAWIHTHCRVSGALCSLHLCRPSSQAPLLAA